MKIKKIMALLMAGAMLAGLAGCAEKEPKINEDVLSVNSSVMNEKNVKPLGRTEFVDDMLWLAYSGSGAEFSFNGSSCKVTMLGDDNIMSEDFDSLPRIAIYLDGERVVEKVLDKTEETFSVLEGDIVGEHTVRIVKLSETGNSTCAVKCVETNSYGRIKATEEKEHSIEFIGDSITCGYGVDSEIGKPFSTRTEDCTKAYAYKTAELLGCDYSLVSKSGHGIISGYSGDGTKQTWGVMPDYYESFGSGSGAFQGESPDSVKWDFKSRKQDVVVINLGTNDYSYTGKDEAKCEEYKLAYIEFVKRVRKLNPDAKLWESWATSFIPQLKRSLRSTKRTPRTKTSPRSTSSRRALMTATVRTGTRVRRHMRRLPRNLQSLSRIAWDGKFAGRRRSDERFASLVMHSRCS